MRFDWRIGLLHVRGILRTRAFAFCLLLPGVAGAIDLQNVRMWPEPGSTRIVFDLSAPDALKVITMEQPNRVVIDFDTAQATNPLRLPMADPNIVADLRHAQRGNGMRVVLDLRKKVAVNHNLLAPQGQYGHRLVIDLLEQSQNATQAQGRAHAPALDSAVSPSTSQEFDEGRDLVIAIDAGHGGEDVGAIGPSKSYEKNIVLAVARDLARLVDAQPGMKAVLIREGDYYVSLRKRTEIARAHGADLFVSVHADAFRDRRVAGSSVYVLSHRGASSEAAQWLADSENASDLVGGVSLGDKDGMLKSVLLGMSQSASLDNSIDLAHSILGGLRQVGKIHKANVERAGFVVLKSPDIPSVLVELAFISNPVEEKKLNDPAYRQKLARAMLAGVNGYFDRHVTPGTRLALLRRSDKPDPILAMAQGASGQSARGVSIGASLPRSGITLRP